MNSPSPSAPGTGPTSGRPSSASGRAQARRPRVGRVRDRRQVARAALPEPSFVVARVRLERQERRPERRPAVRGHEAEADRAVLRVREPAVGLDRGVDAGLLEDMGRRRLEPELDDHAPVRQDRAPGPGRVDDRGGPRPGRHDHGPRAHDAVAGVHGNGGARRTDDPRAHPRPDPGAPADRERGERPAGGGRRDGEADVEPDGRPGPRRGRARAGAGRPARRTRRGRRGCPRRSPRPAPGASPGPSRG